MKLSYFLEIFMGKLCLESVQQSYMQVCSLQWA